MEDRISDIENPLSQIAMSLVGYLTNGQYIDTTGVAITPSKTEQIKEYKTNINMSKNKIRITENELKQIIAESVNKVLNENSAYNPRTYKREKQNEFNRDEINQLASFLQENPIIDMYKPINLGSYKVQRIPANEVSGSMGMLNDRVLISYGSTDGSVYLKIDRKPNTHWMEESGYTYMAWKY